MPEKLAPVWVCIYLKGNLELSGYYSRNADSSKYSADLTKTLAYESLKKMVDENQILIITVPDDEISRVWKQLLKLNIEDKVVCHCSGSLSSKIFFDSTIKKLIFVLFILCWQYPIKKNRTRL